MSNLSIVQEAWLGHPVDDYAGNQPRSPLFVGEVYSGVVFYPNAYEEAYRVVIMRGRRASYDYWQRFPDFASAFDFLARNL